MAEKEVKEVEWEEIEEKAEEKGIRKLKGNCRKLKKDINYHGRMRPVHKVVEMLDGYPKEAPEDPTLRKVWEYCKDPVSRKTLKTVTDAVVQLVVQGKITSYNGTGFVVKVPGVNSGDDIWENAVLTNFHNIRSVKPKDVKVRFFLDSEGGITCDVSEISPYVSPNLDTNLAAPNQDQLDFAMLYIRLPKDSNARDILQRLSPLWYEESSRVQCNEIKDVCVIGHPHGAYKHIAFGELTSDPNNLWRQHNESGNEHMVEYSAATCPGSSGSPVFQMAGGINILVSFIHFRADSRIGHGVPMQSILPKIREKIQQQIQQQQRAAQN